MARFESLLGGALALGLLLTQSGYALTSEGKLTLEAKRALFFLKIKGAEINDADTRPLGLARSIRILLPLVRLQASDNPAAGPLENFANLDAMNKVLKDDKLKNPNLPKIKIADLPPELVSALKAAKLITEENKELTPTQLLALILHKNDKKQNDLIIELQKELNKLGNPAAEPGKSKVAAFWKKLDTASEGLMLSYFEAITKTGDPFARPQPTVPQQITRTDLDPGLGTGAPTSGTGAPRESTLPNPIPSTGAPDPIRRGGRIFSGAGSFPGTDRGPSSGCGRFGCSTHDGGNDGFTPSQVIRVRQQVFDQFGRPIFITREIPVDGNGTFRRPVDFSTGTIDNGGNPNGVIINRGCSGTRCGVIRPGN